MKQAIAGVAPATLEEVTSMIVWPSIAVYPLGQKLGRLFAIRWPDIACFRCGNLVALLSIPIALVLFFRRLAPYTAIRYRLTNRRILVERGLVSLEERALGLGDFDGIDVEILDGQQWFHAGDLVFRRGSDVAFRLQGVSRPETFRHTCLKARAAWRGVRLATVDA